MTSRNDVMIFMFRITSRVYSLCLWDKRYGHHVRKRVWHTLYLDKGSLNNTLLNSFKNCWSQETTQDRSSILYCFSFKCLLPWLLRFTRVFKIYCNILLSKKWYRLFFSHTCIHLNAYFKEMKLTVNCTGHSKHKTYNVMTWRHNLSYTS